MQAVVCKINLRPYGIGDIANTYIHMRDRDEKDRALKGARPPLCITFPYKRFIMASDVRAFVDDAHFNAANGLYVGRRRRGGGAFSLVFYISIYGSKPIYIKTGSPVNTRTYRSRL